jgi:hypothetical protein
MSGKAWRMWGSAPVDPELRAYRAPSLALKRNWLLQLADQDEGECCRAKSLLSAGHPNSSMLVASTVASQRGSRGPP